MSHRMCAVIIVMATVTACRNVGQELANASPSAESLAAAVLDAIASNDRARLEALALNEEEFRNHVWPELPAARPERKLPFSYVWGDLHQKSDIGLSGMLQTHGGKRYTLQSVTFAGVTDYSQYVVHREATFRVRDAGGVERSLQVCGSFLDERGAWKVFSYVAD